MRYSPDDAQVSVIERPGRLHICWTATAADIFHDVRAGFRAAFPRHGDATWDADLRCWSVPAWLRPRVEEWIARTFEPEAVQWERDDMGARSGRYERAQAGPPASLAGALRVLHLTPDAPLELAEHVYRWHAKHAHPDAGGSHEAACAINAAIEIIRDHAQEGAA